MVKKGNMYKVSIMCILTIGSIYFILKTFVVNGYRMQSYDQTKVGKGERVSESVLTSYTYKTQTPIQNENKIQTVTKAIVVLSRGYDELSRFENLIKRNKHLEKYVGNQTDFIIFHEGNIDDDTQAYISKHTPQLHCKFINVSREFRRDEIEFYAPTQRFKMGYRNMCSFWFIGFWKYVSDYDYVLRIDEDVMYYSNPNNVFNHLKNNVVVFAKLQSDAAFVTKGLNDFTKHFFANRRKTIPSASPRGPYTNVIGFNMPLLRNNSILKEYIHDVEKSNNIYIYRWGDLPLWGEVLRYMYSVNQYIEDKTIRYFHGSHNAHIGHQEK
jgi:hypothetical protein